ncbi:kinase domain protein, partial (macronuclear) [Tetrahymena thermophila SB210]
MILFIDFNQRKLYVISYQKRSLHINYSSYSKQLVLVEKQINSYPKSLIQLNFIKNNRKFYLGIEQLKIYMLKRNSQSRSSILQAEIRSFKKKMILNNIQNQFFNILKILADKTSTLDRQAINFEFIYKLLLAQAHSDKMSSLHFQSCNNKDQIFKIIQSSGMLNNLRLILQIKLQMSKLNVFLNKLAEEITHFIEIQLFKIDLGLPLLYSRINAFQAKHLHNKQYKASAAQLQLSLTCCQNCYFSPYQKKEDQYQITFLKMKNNLNLSHEILKENVKLNYQNSYSFLKATKQVSSKVASKTNQQFSVDQQQLFNQDYDTKLIIQQNKHIINKLSQPKLNKLRNALLIGQKVRIIKILQKINKISNKNKSLLFGGGKNLKNIDSDQKTIFKKNRKKNSSLTNNKKKSQLFGASKNLNNLDSYQKTIPKNNRKKISSLINTNVEVNKIKVEFNENQNEQNYSNTQQAEYDELNKGLEQFFLNWPKYIEIIDSSLKMKKQKILDEQKGQQPQSTTIIPQSSQTTFQQSDLQGIYISKSKKYSQFGQKGVERYQTLKEIINTKQQNKENKKNQLFKQKINLDSDSEKFLRQIFKLGDHINSGGEADIFTNQNNDNIVYRVIKLNEYNDLRKQEQELLRFQELQQQNILNIDSSHLIEDKVNHTKYIIYAIQKCQMSLYDEILSKKVFSLRETLKFISTAFHLLIVLRQKYIYHSDIKPGNILKIDDNNYQLSDFGASQQVNFIDPFCNFEMYTPGFKPQDRVKNLPFYHDIYSFGKTIQKLLIQQLENQTEIYDCLNKFIKEICKDDENSINVDCFELPKKFINKIMKFTNDEVIEVFLEEYLKQIEQYLVIKKENKVFQYESQYQYSEIALLIISQISQVNNQQSQLTSIKIKALITKSYILCKRKQYKESLECINEIFREDFKDNSQSEILIKSIRIVTKILIKLNNKTKLSQENQNKLIELIKLVNIGEEFDKLKIKIIELLLLKSNDIYPIITDFYDPLKIQVKNQESEFDMVFRIIIKLIRYLRKQNCYDQSLYNLIQFIQNDKTNQDSYYKQKLLKEMGLYLYKFLFQTDEQLDIKFYFKYEKEIKLLPQIILNCLNDIKLKSNLQIQFDKSIWQLYSIFIKLQELNIYSFDEFKNILDNLEKKYKIIMVKIKKDNQLPLFIEYVLYNKLNYYEKYLKRNNIKNYQFFNEEEISKKEKQIIESICLIEKTIFMDNKKNKNQTNNEISQNKKETMSLLNFITYFESKQISLNYIGSLKKFNEELESLNSQLIFSKIIYYDLNNQEKIFEEITNLNIEIQGEDENQFSYQFDKDGSLNLRISEFSDYSLLNDPYFTFLTSNLRKVQALKFKFKLKQELEQKFEFNQVMLNYLNSFSSNNMISNDLRQIQKSSEDEDHYQDGILYEQLDFYFEWLKKTKILNSITKLTLDFSEQQSELRYQINGYIQTKCSDFKKMCPRIIELNVKLGWIQNNLTFIYDFYALASKQRALTSLKFDLKFKENEETKNSKKYLKELIRTIEDFDYLEINPNNFIDYRVDQNQIDRLFKDLNNPSILEKQFKMIYDNISNDLSQRYQKSNQNYKEREYLFQQQFLHTFIDDKILKTKVLSIISDITEEYLNQSENTSQLNSTSSLLQNFNINDFRSPNQLKYTLPEIYINWQNIYTTIAQNIAQYLQTKQKSQFKLNLIVQGSQLFSQDYYFINCDQINEYVKNHGLSLKQNKESIEMEQLDLHLDFNIICSEAATVIKNMLHKFKINIKLKHSFNIDKINGEGAYYISRAFKKCQNIKLKLELDYNEISDKGAQAIASAIEKLKNTTNLYLNLRSNEIQYEGAQIISNSLEKCQNITKLYLNLSENQIQYEGAQSISNSLEKCQNITKLYLNLSWNQIKEKGAQSISNSLEKCQNITKLNLYLSFNNIQDKGAQSISNSLQKCQNITKLNLDLGHNQIQDEVARMISNSLKNCQNITKLYLNL